jgi:hypothetical protein
MKDDVASDRSDRELRNQLVRMLTVRQAHMDFEDAVADFPHIKVHAFPSAFSLRASTALAPASPVHRVVKKYVEQTGIYGASAFAVNFYAIRGYKQLPGSNVFCGRH